jgi:hypothetical protein
MANDKEWERRSDDWIDLTNKSRLEKEQRKIARDEYIRNQENMKDVDNNLETAEECK